MPDLCLGGCGKELPPNNKSGYAWGHKNGCKVDTPPSNSVATTADEEVEAPGAVSCDLTEAQLNRIWSSLPLPEKALAIMTALDAERE